MSVIVATKMSICILHILLKRPRKIKKAIIATLSMLVMRRLEIFNNWDCTFTSLYIN